MTCHEVRLYFEDPFRIDAVSPGEAEHLGHCTECARIVESRRELGAGLRLVREAAPKPSPALEVAVLDTYRQLIRGDAPLVGSRARGFMVVYWTTAAAAVLALAAALVFHPTHRFETSNLKIESAQLPLAHQAASEKRADVVPGTNAASSPKTRRRASRAATTKSRASEDFRSLMYCDALSCGGAMELIRVELPSSAAAFEQAAGSPDRVIYADVLVGSDGIARGIRVVQ